MTKTSQRRITLLGCFLVTGHFPASAKSNSFDGLKGRTMKEKRQRPRFFVCMKTRDDGRPCCARQGALVVLNELRRQIFRRGEKCSHIDVRPSGCLDRCDEGPVLMAFYGRLAEAASPSRELVKASLDDAAYTFTKVSLCDVSTILDTVLELHRNNPNRHLVRSQPPLSPNVVGGSNEICRHSIRKKE